MKIDPKNLNLTPEVVSELEKNYDTRVVFEDYFIDFTAYEGEINDRFFRIFKQRLAEAVEPNEVWKKRYVGKDVDGWEHLEQKLYKGPESIWMEPHALHMRIDLYFRPRREPKKQLKPYKMDFGSKVVYGFLTMFALDKLFPPKAGESVFMRNTIGGYAFVKYMEAKHQKDREEEDEE